MTPFWGGIFFMLFGGFFGFLGGIPFGIRLRGLVPLRSPSNKVRIENAEADARVAELIRERRQHEMNLERDEILGAKEIESVRHETLQLTSKNFKG